MPLVPLSEDVSQELVCIFSIENCRIIYDEFCLQLIILYDYDSSSYRSDDW